MVSVRPPTARPVTARALPPRVVRADDLAELSGLENDKMALNAKPVENLITESKDDEDEEETAESFFVEETEIATSKLGGVESDLSGQTKGSLVKQLVESKKELEGKDFEEKNASKDEPLARLAARDIEKMRESIQTLSRQAKPLGRVLEYLQEDLDAMLRELATWKEESQQNERKLQTERASIDSSLEPLKKELENLDFAIAEQLEKISASKAGLLRNDQQLVAMVSAAVGKV